MTGDPAFLSAPAVSRNPVGPLVTGEEALNSKADLGTPSSSQDDAAEPGLSHKLRGIFGGNAGSFLDGVLTTCASQVGQIMLTLPNAMAKTGLIAGLLLAVSSACMSLWTMYMLITLYLERKHRLIQKGLWYDANGRRAIITQYHEVIGSLLGMWAQIIVQLVIIISLVGTSFAQIVACASDVYYYDSSKSKREWTLIWGGISMMAVLLPTLRHFRIVNVIALVGTTYTTWFIVATAAKHGMTPGAASRGPLNLQNFYVGASVLFSAFGGHAMALEIMDAMWVPAKYSKAYLASFFYIFVLTLPHSISVQLAYPDANLKNGNVYGVLPKTRARNASIIMMLMHQLVAFCLYSAPLYYMWEKLLHVHSKSLWLRIPLRVPVALFIWFLAIAFPFYGNINSIIGAITSPAIAFIFPCLAYSWVYRTPQARANCPLLPPRFMRVWNWTPIFLLNTFIVLWFLVNGVGFGIAYSTIQIVDDVKTFHVFAECYQCPAKSALSGSG